MKKALISLACLLFVFCVCNVYGQSGKETWKTLTKIGWKTAFNEYIGTEIQLPIFSDEVNALNGKEITIQGYILPLDLSEGNYLILSAFPYASCFFCGNAGPETVMEVYMKKPQLYAADEKVTFKGKLKLNQEDGMHLIYMLEEAEPVEVD